MDVDERNLQVTLDVDVILENCPILCTWYVYICMYGRRWDVSSNLGAVTRTGIFPRKKKK